jgi:hypothetical protein
MWYTAMMSTLHRRQLMTLGEWQNSEEGQKQVAADRQVKSQFDFSKELAQQERKKTTPLQQIASFLNRK